VYVGIGLSVAGMAAAAFGYLSPVQGALVQEGIDVAVILNALRALGGPRRGNGAGRGLPQQDLLALEAEHRSLGEVLDDIRTTAERIRHLRGPAARMQLDRLDHALRSRLLPHEKHDDDEIYARIRRQSGSPDVLAGMSRTHMEMQRQVHTFGLLRRAVGPDGPTEAQRDEIQRILHGLEAITRLHFAQEDEIYRLLEVE
jgi:hypothetical protein